MSKDNKAKIEEFDEEIYQMHSPNNMTLLSNFKPVDEEEQKKIDAAFKA